MTAMQTAGAAQAMTPNRPTLSDLAKQADRSARAEIILVAAAEDPELGDKGPRVEALQAEFRAFVRTLDAVGLAYSQRASAFDPEGGDGYSLPEYLVRLKDLDTGRLAAIGAAAAAWLRGHPGRTVRLKIGAIDMEADGVATLEPLLRFAARIRAGEGTS